MSDAFVTAVGLSFLAGLVVGGYFGIKFGHARARALRAWTDRITGKKSIIGLFKKTVREWSRAAKYIGLGAAVATVSLILIYASTSNGRK